MGAGLIHHHLDFLVGLRLFQVSQGIMVRHLHTCKEFSVLLYYCHKLETIKKHKLKYIISIALRFYIIVLKTSRISFFFLLINIKFL